MTGSLHISFDARKPTPHARHYPLTVKFGPGRGEVVDRTPLDGKGRIDWPSLDIRLENYRKSGAMAARVDAWGVKYVPGGALPKIARHLPKALAAGLTITIAVPEIKRIEYRQEVLL